MMRFARVVLALVFGLAMAGPETHACPVDSATPAPQHHDSGDNHQGAAHCTCPQACCPPGVHGVLAPSTTTWQAATGSILAATTDRATSVLLPRRKHVLPLALAPPLAVA